MLGVCEWIEGDHWGYEQSSGKENVNNLHSGDLDLFQTDIAKLEANSGTSLPNVEFGASFSEMAEALENLLRH